MVIALGGRYANLSKELCHQEEWFFEFHSGKLNLKVARKVGMLKYIGAIPLTGFLPFLSECKNFKL